MSWDALAWARAQTTGSPTRKAVLLSLANVHNHHTGQCNPRIEIICEDTELGETAVKTALRVLVKDGFLTRSRRRRSDGSLGTYDYAFPALDAPPQARGDSRPEAADDSRPQARGDSQNLEVQNQEDLNQTLAAAPRAYDPLKGTKIEGRNLPWDALVKATNADETAEKGRIARALKTIREIVVRDSSEQTFRDPQNGEWWIARQISARAAMYRRRWPHVECTPTALAANWGRVATAQPGSDPVGTMEAAQRGIDSARRTA